jgi:hypothetical protein
MSRVDRFGRQVTKPNADYAAAVVGAAVTRINVGGAADSFIVEV